MKTVGLHPPGSLRSLGEFQLMSAACYCVVRMLQYVISERLDITSTNLLMDQELPMMLIDWPGKIGTYGVVTGENYTDSPTRIGLRQCLRCAACLPPL